MSLRLRKNVTLVEAEDGAVLLDEASGKYWQLNPSGALILQTLSADGTVEQAAEALMDRYQVDVEQARSDVTDLLSALRSARLIRR